MSLKIPIFVICCFALTVGPALPDTLHGFCVAPAPSCLDNNTITPTSTNPPDFGFKSSGTTEGNFELLVLVPNNEDVSPSTYSLEINGSNVSDPTVLSTLFSTTAFTKDTLENYLNVSYTSPNPLSAWLPSTQAVDPGATGYFVYLFNFGAETGNPKNQGTAPTFSIASGSVESGSIFGGLEFTGDSISTGSIFGATNQSGAIIENGDPPSPSVPEPATFALVGLALLGLCSTRKIMAARK